MKRHPLATLALAALLLALGAGAALAGPPARPLGASSAPTVVSYQGQVTVGGVPHNGSGYFKFAVVDAAGTTSYWSNDGTSANGSQPSAAVSLTVTNGLFTVLLGDSGMNALTADVFDGSERYLRVWFCQSATGSFVQLAPDRRIAAVPYALQATNADTLDGKHLADLVQANGTLQANLNADLLDGHHATHFAAAGHNHDGSYWQLGGNAGTTGSHFLGTSDGQPLELRVNGARALRLEPNATSPNVIGGHWANNATAGVLGATIAGGGATIDGASYANAVTADYGTVVGGVGNVAGGEYATVGGGSENKASGPYATVGGGSYNSATSYYSTVAGGYGNKATGNYSFAGGRQAHADHDGAFVWADSTNADISSTGPNQFIVRASGGIWLGTTSPPSIPEGRFLNTSTGAHLTTGGQWVNNSDRTAKENLAPVDWQEVLQRLAAMPISTWSYKAEDASVRHMGPMAQDFYAAFGLGDSDTSIGTIDADGVALAAIQGLYQRSQEQAARIAELEDENATLRAQMADFEARLAALEQGR